MTPTLHQAPLCTGAVQLYWDEPTISNGADIKQATVCSQQSYRIISYDNTYTRDL